MFNSKLPPYKINYKVRNTSKTIVRNTMLNGINIKQDWPRGVESIVTAQLIRGAFALPTYVVTNKNSLSFNLFKLFLN